jgi:hypothetical protein
LISGHPYEGMIMKKLLIIAALLASSVTFAKDLTLFIPSGKSELFNFSNTGFGLYITLSENEYKE